MHRRVKSAKTTSGIDLQSTKGDIYIHLKKEFNLSEQEISEMGTLKYCMIMQRIAEPIYKKEIDDMINSNKEK